MIELIRIALQGALLVAAVSLQTVMLARAPWTLAGAARVGLGAVAVALIWWGNVQTSVAVTSPGWGGLAYAVGSGAGAVAGWAVARRTARRD